MDFLNEKTHYIVKTTKLGDLESQASCVQFPENLSDMYITESQKTKKRLARKLF